MKHTVLLETSESVPIIDGAIEPNEGLTIDVFAEIGINLDEDRLIRLTMGGLLEVSLNKEETLILVEQLIKSVNRLKPRE